MHKRLLGLLTSAAIIVAACGTTTTSSAPASVDPGSSAPPASVDPGVEQILLFQTFAKNLPMAAAMGPWGSYELSRKLSLSMRDSKESSSAANSSSAAQPSESHRDGVA